MIDGVRRDHARFRQIVRGKIKQDLKKYIQHSEMFGRKGKDTVTIPMPQIDIPRFRFGSNQGGVGQGDGEAGDPVEAPRIQHIHSGAGHHRPNKGVQQFDGDQGLVCCFGCFHRAGFLWC